MPKKYSESSYSPSNAMTSISARFWEKYQENLLAYAKDRTRTDIPKKIHSDWDGLLHWPCCTNRRIEWAIALYEHGDWPGLEQSGKEAAAQPKQPSESQTASIPEKPGQKESSSVKKKCSNCRFAKNPERCGHGGFGPCEDWVEATKVEEYWPTWEDMKRAEQEDYRSRYRKL